MQTQPEHRDGRTVRAERTRSALVDSLLALLDEGELRPTAAEIADRAGVSERSVFQHFPDREALLEAVAREQYERVMPTLTPVDASRSLYERIDAFAAQRCRLFEQVKGVRRAALLMEHESEVVAGWLTHVRASGARRGRARVSPRARAARRRDSRDRLRAALVAACAWPVWREPAPAPGAGRRAHPRRDAPDPRARYSASAESSSAIAWVGVHEAHRSHAERPGGFAVDLEVVDEQAVARRPRRRRGARA